ncbi:CocE/NonD family hydrolase [Tardiphaga sp.]|uniref:alpha/beta hydrolase family protein n=1 Tax=Tardiphaga sp. TaxID=1926292 RepID=UPI002638350C|nr:CocE/NonD family hydrolase [Tardiphaga sp.]MDB5620240.1 dienelactone hydrolase [Tardiphaga sp.]
MISRALLACAILCGAIQAVRADELHREDLRIPMAAAGPRGLEAMLLRPSGSGRYPLALISHGAPRDVADRAGMTPSRSYSQAAEFARRGFAALVVMRRGYGQSDGTYAENSGPCDRRNYMIAGKASATDLRAAIAAMGQRADVTTQGMIAVGVSAGGFASVALAADPPQGLAAVINFAGGRGSRADNDVCSEAALVEAFASYGRTARAPMLWIYAANDKFFGPDLAHRLHGAFTASGGRAQFIDAPAFGSDGHFLFSATGIGIWTPMVDRFLREQNLGTRDLISLPVVNLTPPAHLSDNGRANFATYLRSGPHKAFAVSPKGAFAFRTGMRSPAEAEAEALAACGKYSGNCSIYATDDRLAPKPVAR